MGRPKKTVEENVPFDIENVEEDESPKDIIEETSPVIPVVEPKISTKFPVRPDNLIPVLKDEVLPSVNVFKEELVEKVPESPPVPGTHRQSPKKAGGQHYARRNIVLINDVNNVLSQVPIEHHGGNPANRDSNGVMKLNKNKTVGNVGGTVHTGGTFHRG